MFYILVYLFVIVGPLATFLRMVEVSAIRAKVLFSALFTPQWIADFVHAAQMVNEHTP